MTRKTRRRSATSAIALVLGITLALVGTPTVSHAADNPDDPGFATIRANWRWTLDGGASNPHDPATAAAITLQTAEATTLQAAMDKTAGRTTLWSDLGVTPTQDQATAIGLAYQRLEKMAITFRTNGSTLQNNVGLKDDIVGGLTFLNDTAYSSSMSPVGNWWWNSVGSGIALMNTTILMWDHLAPSVRASYAQAVKKAGGGGCGANSRGPNSVWFCTVLLLRGAVSGNEADVLNAKNHILATMTTDELASGEGFLPDGSITTHGFSYNGGYGVEAVAFIAAVVHAVDSSRFDYTPVETAPLFDSVLGYYGPFFYNGAIVSAVRGREISRSVRGDHTAGARVLAALATLAKEAPVAERPIFTSFIKAQVAGNSQDVYAGLPVSSIRDIQLALLGATPSSPTASKVFSFTDRVMHSRPTWTYALSMHSSRLYNYEIALNENLRGWFTGDGAGFLYNGDGNQTDGAYWPTVDANYLPGTIVMDKSKTDPRVLGQAWVGGTTIGSGNDAYTAAGMDYAPRVRLQATNAIQPQLAAKKSWFLFDNEVVLLEAGVTSPSANAVRSVIENRKLTAAGTNALTVTTSAGSTSLTSATMGQTFTDVTSMHLVGNGTGDSMGYVFPDGPASIFGYRNAYSNKWSSINANQSQNPPGDPMVTERYQLLTRPYPAQPAGESFSYVLLPNATSSEVDTYRETPETQTLANSSTVQAVEESTLGVVAANFWTDSPTEVNRGGSAWLTADMKASVIVRVTASTIEVSVSDPTQLNDGIISIGVAMTAQSKASGDARIAMTSDVGENLTFTVDVAGARGSSVTAVFAR